MYQYASKKTAASVKKASSGRVKNSVPSRRRVFNSLANQRDRQVSENRISSPPIVTAIAPRADDQYSAGAAGWPINDYPGDLGFIEYVLANHGRELIRGEEVTSRAKKILKKWKQFLPQFLKLHGFRSHGANQGHTFHRTEPKGTEEPLDRCGRKGMSKIRGIYHGTANIRKSRKYEANEKIKRYLRHCAAVLALYFGIKSEIQCYYDGDLVYVAANSKADERKLSGIHGKNILGYLTVLQSHLKQNNKHMADNDNFPIRRRFLLKRAEHDLTCPPPLERAEFQVIKSGDIAVQTPGLHAERKILYYLRDQKGDQDMLLDPLRLGGIRRPCLICSTLCLADRSQVHPGPVWVSKAASTPKNVGEMFLILEAIRNNITYMTSKQNGNPTNDCDTDSESSTSGRDIH